MKTVTPDQMRAAYDALGLDPERWEDTAEITIVPDAVVVRVMDRPRRVTALNTIEGQTLVYLLAKDEADA